MKKVLVLINSLSGLYNFRKEVMLKLVKEGYQVIISAPDHDKANYFRKIGCDFIETPINRRGTNPISDFKLLIKYIRMMKKVRPDIVLTYTIKPNIYGGIAAKVFNAKILHTVTGLGTVYIQDIWQKKIIVNLNRMAFKSASGVFFLNEENKEFYLRLGILSNNHKIDVVPGSGVNLNKFNYTELRESKSIKYTFIGRVFKDKGIEEFLGAAKEMKKEYDNIEFRVVGPVEDEKYKSLLEQYNKEIGVMYLGRRDNVSQIMTESTCIVLPSYGEGRGTVLQEGAAVGRALITCDTYGCKDNVEEGFNGLLCEVGSAGSLKNAMKRFADLSFEEKKKMGFNSRVKAENEFDREIVIETYIARIGSVL